MKIEVKTAWLENKNSRSAYYQVFEFTPERGSMVTVTHWGPLRTASHIWHRPVLGGQTKIEIGAMLSTRVMSKVNRKYSLCDSKSGSFGSDSPYLVELFGASLAHQIETEMGIVGPTGDPDNKVIEKSNEPRPAMWGVW